MKTSGVNSPRPSRHGLARVISKLGLMSRSEAARWVAGGRVRVNELVILDPEFPVREGVDRVDIQGIEAGRAPRQVLMLNKPRGLVTTTRDERGRDTVYRCFDGADLPWVAPVGRLDKASEGLLLFANDPVWAARITAPGTGPDKTYHVHVGTVPTPALIADLANGALVDGERLAVKSAQLLRAGGKNGWLEIVLDEGRNRHIRRLLDAFDIRVLRLGRTAIGPLVLGDLGKGQWRPLTDAEVASL